MADTCQKLLDSDKPLFDISVNTGQISMGFKADTLEKLQKYANFIRLLDKYLV